MDLFLHRSHYPGPGNGGGAAAWAAGSGEKPLTISAENAFWLTCTEVDEPMSYGVAAGEGEGRVHGVAE